MPAATSNRRQLLLPVAAFLAVLPLILHGCSCGHDFDFHLLNWMEVSTQLAHGNLHPHWAYTPAYNAGEPRFLFYPPLSWYLGALLGLLLTHLPGLSEAAAQTWGWTATPILFTWIALTLSGLTLYRLARAFVSPNAALLAATLYLANPYMLFTAYERTAYAELLAAAWIPLLFLGILRARPTVPGIAIPLALLWLTNAPAAVMGTYTLAFLALIRLATTPSHKSGAPLFRSLTAKGWGSSATEPTPVRLALIILSATLLGFALAAFYIVPVAAERPFVHLAMAIIPGLRIQDNFLFHHTSGPDASLHDQVLHTASLIAVTLLAATALALVLNRVPNQSRVPHVRSGLTAPDLGSPQSPLLPLTLLATTIAFLLTPWSLPLWNHAPQAAYLQFPWRLLAILACVLALAAATIPGAPLFRSLTAKGWGALATTLLLATTLILPAYHLFAQRCFPEDTPPARLALFHSNLGTDPTDEYTPATADNDALALTDPPYWLAATPTATPPPNRPGPAPTHLTLTAPTSGFLILNLRAYPAWRITIDGSPAPRQTLRPDGLIALAIPSGPSTIDIRYAHTPDQTLGDAITVLALFTLLAPNLLRKATRENDQGTHSSATTYPIRAEILNKPHVKPRNS